MPVAVVSALVERPIVHLVRRLTGPNFTDRGKAGIEDPRDYGSEVIALAVGLSASLCTGSVGQLSCGLAIFIVSAGGRSRFPRPGGQPTWDADKLTDRDAGLQRAQPLERARQRRPGARDVGQAIKRTPSCQHEPYPSRSKLVKMSWRFDQSRSGE